RILGEEARHQCRQLLDGGDPDVVVACVGGGSNAAGTFSGFAATGARLVGVEAAGGAAIGRGIPGVVHGMKSFILQDEHGQVLEAHSVSAGLDYPGVGPEHAHLAAVGRARYVAAGDAEVLDAFQLLSRTEGIIPALEPAHAVAWVARAADPVMDGPTIQEASHRALESGTTPLGVLDALRDVDVEVPLVVMTYYNIVFRTGHRRFARSLVDNGVGGAVVPDVPLEELGDWARAAEWAGVET